ncbi:tripartite motif protein-containing protein 26, partial [Desulfobacter hydrogenophilus]|nr:tripartite motif protein-containing protein 26 [Desulfobacter hydrogenophilus]
GVSDEAPPLQVVQQIRHVIFLSSTTSCEAD